MASGTEQTTEPWYLKSSDPVFFSAHPALTLPSDEFERFLRRDLQSGEEELGQQGTATPTANEDRDTEDSFSMVSHQPSTTAEVRDLMRDTELDETEEVAVAEQATGSSDIHVPRFIAGLDSYREEIENENKMHTENGAVAFRSTNEATLDLFDELEDVISGPRLLELLNASWNDNPLLTLKIIFNARSIHLGKASRPSFYRCAGWLAQHHPLTLITNLRWLSRGVIEKKRERKEINNEEEAVFVDKDPDTSYDPNDPARFDVKNGVAHGYWKDMLNLLAIAVNGHLGPLSDPKEILNVERQDKGVLPSYVESNDAKALRRAVRDQRHKNAQTTFENDATYRGLHLTVARLFAEQLKKDLASLRSDKEDDKTYISLCAKWAPSSGRFHDKHTFVTSSIAEILYPFDDVAKGDDAMPRDVYLRLAREFYRRDISALREHLCIVERYMSAKKVSQIRFDQVPSIAMNKYAPIFAKKDTSRFEKYIDGLAEGKSRISGAVLLPSTLISTARLAPYDPDPNNSRLALEKPYQAIARKALDGQWRTLVQRIRDSGTLESSIAVCDVSGSMTFPEFPDGTCPMDSAIGLSLLLAEVTRGGFGGHFITFSEQPNIQKINLEASLHEKVRDLVRADWGGNTDFEAVFLKLILPMAKREKLSQEEMVKQIFVFSDMQFDTAKRGIAEGPWDTTYQHIKKAFSDSGYEAPRLIFWNLAGGRGGHRGGGSGDPTAPKPVEACEEDTALVSGYSQGMLKAFLDNGGFDEPEEDEEMIKVTEDGEEEEKVVTKKRRKMDPMSTMKRILDHKAYEMLKVVD